VQAMALIEQFKNYIGRLQLEKELKSKRKKQKLISFTNVNQIGIVYHANNTEQEKIITSYAADLRAEGLKVYMLGYVDSKQLPANKKFLLYSEYFWKEKLNGFNLPLKGKIGQFLQTEFDVLLNLYYEPLLPLQAIAAYSKAKYNLGANIKDGLPFNDVVIDTGSQQNDIKYLIEQIDFYLHQLK